MTTEAPALTTLSGEMPSIRREAVQKQLRPQENVLATLEVDLDQQLRFVKGLVVLTNQRLLSCAGTEQVWTSWDLQAGQKLLHHDHAGVGHIDLLDAECLVGQLALHAGTEPVGHTVGGPIPSSTGTHGFRPAARASIDQRLSELQSASGARPGGVPGVYQGGSYPAQHLDAVPPLAFCPALSKASYCWGLC